MDMIPYFSYERIDLGFIALHTWGLLVGLGFALGAWYVLRQAKKNNFDENKILNLILVIFVSSFIGARFFYALQFGWEYFSNGEIFKIWDGGLMFYGGFIGGLAGSVIYMYFSYPLALSSKSLLSGFNLNGRVNEILKTADLFVPGLALGLIVGRVGCFLINDHLGALTQVSWAIKFPDETLRHPVILYLIISNILLFVTTIFLKNRLKQIGALSLFFVLWYSMGRLILDFFRANDAAGLIDPRMFSLTVSQIISVIILFSIAVMILVWPSLRLKIKSNN